MDKVWMEVDPLARTTAPAELDTKGHALPRAGIDAKDEPMKAVEPVPLPLPALAPIHMPTPVLDVSTHRCRTGDEIEQEKVANAKETDALSIDSDAFALPAADGEPLLPINLAPPTLIDEGEEIEDDEDEVPAEASRTSVVRFGSPIAHHRSSSPTPSEGSTTQEEPEPGPPVEVPAESSQSFLASSSSSPAKAPAKKPKLVKPMSANALETLRARFALSAIERPTSSRPYARRIRALKVEPALPECNPSQRTETATASMKRRPGTSSSRVVLITTRLKQSKPIEAKGHVVVRATRILDVAPSVASDASIDELAIVPRR